MKRSLLPLLASFLVTASCAHHSQAPQPQSGTNPTDRTPSMNDSDSSARTPAEKREGIYPENQMEIAQKCALPNKLAKLPQSIFLKHKSMLVNYNPRQRAPNWIYHELYRENLERACFKRPKNDPFKEDPQLHELVAGFGAAGDLSILNQKSFSKTGFDRGHLAPNADFAYDESSQRESFYMTNMLAQEPDVNQQTWEKLERRVRGLACGMGHVRVYTGPIFQGSGRQSPNSARSLESCAMIPDSYYKALLAVKNGRYYGVAFIYSQNDRVGKNFDKAGAKGDISNSRMVSIADVERATGIPLFTEFAEDIQKEFKSQKDLSGWTEDDCSRRLCSNSNEKNEE